MTDAPRIQLIKQIMPKKFLLAVSMGVDSYAALKFLTSKKYEVIPIHFHHGCPGNKTADKAAAKFVIETQDNRDHYIEFGQNGQKSEKELRDSRLNFYSNAAKKFGIRQIVTAHHLDDWVEGYLMNCFRGQPEREPIPLTSNFPDFDIFHPFLLNPKSAFERYLNHNGFDNFVVDSSNSVIKGSRRNFVRIDIIPKLMSNEVCLRKYGKKRISDAIRSLI